MKIVIVGCGQLGGALVEKLSDKPVSLLCCCDNAVGRQGTMFRGHPVLSVDEAVARHGGSAKFVVAIYNASAVLQQLRKAKCQDVVTSVQFSRSFDPTLLTLGGFSQPTAISKDPSEVARCRSVWSDAESAELYDELIAWLDAPSYSLAKHQPPQDTYLPDDLWKPHGHENVADCGAFGGDTIRSLVAKGLDFDSVTAYEPDAINFQTMKEWANTQEASVRDRLVLVNAAVGSSSGTVPFSPCGSETSLVSAEGTEHVRCVALDDEFEEFRSVAPTYVKMDIEGFELEALAGMARLMRERPPVLAVTTYHKVEHQWQIPLLIHDTQPGYKLYLRKYAEDCWETVCYAVPPWRAL